MQIIIVASKSDNQVIGKENDLIWDLPADWAFFLAVIEGAYLITGRKSYESAPGEEVFGPHRSFAIITRNTNYTAKNGTVVHSLEAAITTAKNTGARKVCILGGSTIYKPALQLAHRMLITEVHEHFAGDAFFPPIDLTYWKETSRIRHRKDAINPYDYSFVEYEKRGLL